MTVKQTAGRDSLGDFAPEFAHLNDDILFGEVWNRTDRLSLKQRSIVTVTALMAQGLTDSSFEYHLRTARSNGVTAEEISEILTHAAFYAGWPKAWAAFRIAREVWKEPQTLEEYACDLPFPVGEPNTAYSQYFDGKSWLAPVADRISNVTFEPGCRNHWHIHKAVNGGGQILIGVKGRGWYQEWGKEPVQILPGTVVSIPVGVKHWHGAADDSWFSHLAIEVPGFETGTEWLESASESQIDG